MQRLKNSEYKTNERKLAENTEENDLEVINSNDLKVGKQCDKAANKGNQILGLINRIIISRKKVILNLYNTLVHPQLEYYIQAWRPHLVKDIEKLDSQHWKPGESGQICWRFSRY